MGTQFTSWNFSLVDNDRIGTSRRAAAYLVRPARTISPGLPCPQKRNETQLSTLTLSLRRRTGTTGTCTRCPQCPRRRLRTVQAGPPRTSCGPPRIDPSRARGRTCSAYRVRRRGISRPRTRCTAGAIRAQMRESPSAARTPPQCCRCRVRTPHSRGAGIGAVATAPATSVDGVRCCSFSATASSTVRRGRECAACRRACASGS